MLFLDSSLHDLQLAFQAFGLPFILSGNIRVFVVEFAQGLLQALYFGKIDLLHFIVLLFENAQMFLLFAHISFVLDFEVIIPLIYELFDCFLLFFVSPFLLLKLLSEENILHPQ